MQSVEVSLGSHGKIMRQWGDLRSIIMSLDFTSKNQSILEYVQRYKGLEKSQGRVLLFMRFRREENMKVSWQFSLPLRSYNADEMKSRTTVLLGDWPRRFTGILWAHSYQ